MNLANGWPETAADHSRRGGADRELSGRIQHGEEYAVDAYGCCADRLRSREPFDRLIAGLIDDLTLHLIGELHWHRFPPPGGLTVVALLRESHLAIHTFPETQVATFNLYCCRRRPPWRWDQRLRDELSATRVVIRVLERGNRMLTGVQDV